MMRSMCPRLQAVIILLNCVRFFQAGAGDALIGIDPCHLPVRAVLDLLGVVGLLRLIAVELLFAVRRDAAVGRYAHFSVMVSVQFFRFSGCGDHPNPPL